MLEGEYTRTPISEFDAFKMLIQQYGDNIYTITSINKKSSIKHVEVVVRVKKGPVLAHNFSNNEIVWFSKKEGIAKVDEKYYHIRRRSN